MIVVYQNVNIAQFESYIPGSQLLRCNYFLNALEDMLVMQKLRKIWEIQTKRYQKKGKTNTIIAFTLLFAILSLSLYFGKMFWPQQVENRASFVFYSELTIHTIAMVVSLLAYLPGYLNWAPSYEQYKINKGAKWPWEREDWSEVFKKFMKNFLMTELLIYPLIVYLATSMGIKQRFDAFPSFWELAGQIMVIFFLEDTCFYLGHRLFHQVPVLYKYHKVHHEFDKVFTTQLEYIHPVDLILGNVLPSAIAMTLLGSKVHCFTYLFWMAYKVFIGNEHHGGYEFPWSPLRIMPFVCGPSFHDHHHSNNVGNYAGSMYLWDVLLDTSDHYFKDFLKQK